jgi:LysR family nitrogen assimilation transcriptional regulator
MELKSIRFFIAVATLGNISRAAQELGIVQPALTRQINQLEEEFGVRLFSRLPRGVQLTTAGREFLEYCRRIIDEVERAKHELTAQGSQPRGLIALGSTTTLARVLMPTVLGKTLMELPQVSLRVVEGRSVRLHEQLLTGALDIAILTNPLGSHQLSMQPLMAEPLCLVARPELLPRKKSLTASEIATFPLVITPGMLSLAMGSQKRSRQSLKLLAEVESIETIRCLLLSETTATIVPPTAFWEDLQAGRLMAIPLRSPIPQRMLVLATRTDNADLPSIRHLGRIIRQSVQQSMAPHLSSMFETG